jgi:hypothetical protein
VDLRSMMVPRLSVAAIGLGGRFSRAKGERAELLAAGTEGEGEGG